MRQSSASGAVSLVGLDGLVEAQRDGRGRRQTLQNNLSTVDFSSLLIDVMTIADEVDSQLKQTISSFMGQATERQAA
jgi:hypothetical protein